MHDAPKATLDEARGEVRRLLDAGDTDQLYLNVTKRILHITKVVADRVCQDVDVPVIGATLVIRCIARKTEEALAALIDLVELGHDYSAATMLRQMCEELIFAEYLRAISRDDADEFVRHKAILECHEGIEAQEDFFTSQQKVFGQPDSSDPTLTVRMTESERGVGDTIRSKLKDIGKRVGWGNKPTPSVKQMSERAGMMDVYDFFTMHLVALYTPVCITYLGWFGTIKRRRVPASPTKISASITDALL
jgi:hypothetical protein